MKIKNLNIHNIENLYIDLPSDKTLGISGWSGSGKSSFCRTIADESIKRIVTILPKSQYMFAFPHLVKTNFGSLECVDLPCIEHLDNRPASANIRSTVGTHSGIFREIRSHFAYKTGLPSELFSFNTPIGWCNTCKGRGSIRGKACKECIGTRYSKAVLKHRISPKEISLNISEANELSFERLLELGQDLGISKTAQHIINNAVELGIGYLQLNRAAATLSGGEFTRLLLAERMGLTQGMLYILDEPGLGLDEGSTDKLLMSLSQLGEKNQIWIIDHSQHVINSTEQHLFFGPGSGAEGGKIVDEIMAVDFKIPEKKPTLESSIAFENLSCRTIDIPHLALPTRAIVAITGESGSGKTTLVRDTILPSLRNMKCRTPEYVYIGQGRNNAVTSRSTISTFLGLTPILRKSAGKQRKPCQFCSGTGLSDDSADCTWCIGTGMDSDFYQSIIWKGVKISDLLTRPISESIQAFPEESQEKTMLEFLVRLGAGYLSLGRKIRTLSTGEFQRIHLCREFATGQSVTDQRIFILDEPSRGLSQNYLNEFAIVLRELVEASGATVWLIEHNKFLLACSDFIVDFGKRCDKVQKLEVCSYEDWGKNKNTSLSPHPDLLRSYMDVDTGVFNIDGTNSNRHTYFEQARIEFESGLLRTLSPTADWIYGRPDTPPKSSTVAIDLEEDILYSEGTFLFEILDISGRLLILSGRPHSELSRFDYMNREQLCGSCKGTGEINSFNLQLVIANEEQGLWEELLNKEVMEAIRAWNYSKIKFLFKQIKSSTGLDLSKPLIEMSPLEYKALWYGLWNRSYHWPQKGASYTWRGLSHLIQKYMRSSSSILKSAIKESKYTIICPVCDGSILAHSQPLSIKGIDIREIMQMEITEASQKFPEIELLSDISKVVPIGTTLKDRVKAWPKEKAVALKMLELEKKKFIGYRFVFRNVGPWFSDIESNIESLSQKNCVELCDSEVNKMTREQLLKLQPSFKSTTPVWESIGFKNIKRELGKLKKNLKCVYCSGSGSLKIENPEENLEKANVPCDACHGDGFDPAAYTHTICGAPASTWLNGIVANLPSEIQPPQWEILADIKLTKTLQQIPKYQLADLIKWKSMHTKLKA